MTRIKTWAIALALLALAGPAFAQSTTIIVGRQPDGTTKPAGVNPSGALATSSPAVTTGGATPYQLISAASTNSTLVASGPRTLYALQVTGLNATAAYVRLYDSATAPTCSSGVNAVHSYLVIGSATQQGGMVIPIPSQGEAYVNGLAFCITGGPAANDNTSAPAGVLVNASYK